MATTNSAYQTLIDKLKAGAAALPPATLAQLAKGIYTFGKREDFDFAASITAATIDDSAISTINTAGSTQNGLMTTSQAALATSLGTLKTNNSMGPIFHPHHFSHHLGFGASDPFAGSGNALYKMAATFAGFDEASDRMFLVSPLPLNTSDQYQLTTPTFHAYDFTKRTWTALWTPNGVDQFDSVSGNTKHYAFPILLAKSTDAADLRWAMVIINATSPANRTHRIRAYSDNHFGAGLPGVHAYEIPPATYPQAQQYLVYDATNHILIGDQGSNSSSHIKIFWDTFLTFSQGTAFNTAYADNALYFDIPHAFQGGPPSFKGPIFDPGHDNAALSISLGTSPWLRMRNFGPSVTGQFSTTPIGMGAWPQQSKNFVTHSWFYRKSNDVCEFRHGTVLSNPTEAKWATFDSAGPTIYYCFVCPEDFSYTIFDSSFKPQRTGQFHIPRQTNQAYDATKLTSNVQGCRPVFWHPTKDELVIQVFRNYNYGTDGSTGQGYRFELLRA